MFSSNTYVSRRKKLKSDFKSGLLLFPGNRESPMNYPANQYHFRQDSSFLYYWGLTSSGLAAIIDIDENKEIVFGNDFDLDDQIWMGPQKPISERAATVGVRNTAPGNDLAGVIQSAIRNRRPVLFLPQYRAENILLLEKLLGINGASVNSYNSHDLIKAVVSQRSIKSPEEIGEIEKALEISFEMYSLALGNISPGLYESDISGLVEGRAMSMGSSMSFPVICSIHGETLHNHFHGNMMKKGDLLLLDSGAESAMFYASDITRTFPVSGKFSQKQRAVYEVVLAAQTKAIEMIKPGISYKIVHLEVSKIIAEGMKEIGLMKGNIDSAVEAGAHAMFFPHGLGHMLGLDVHDMESLGENFVGYDARTKRSDQFGLAYLRMAKKLEPGHVVTVEPGIYFIPQLIETWKKERKFRDFINYDKLAEYKNFGGIRIEDDVLVTKTGRRVLGKPIPKTVAEIEEAMS